MLQQEEKFEADTTTDNWYYLEENGFYNTIDPAWPYTDNIIYTSIPTGKLPEIKPTKRSDKRPRTKFTVHQLLTLEEMFQQSNYMDRISRIELAKNLHLSEKKIKIWFQNRRMKKKKVERSLETKIIQVTNYSLIEDQHGVEQISHQGSPKQVHPFNNNQISGDVNHYNPSISNTQLRPNQPNQDLKNSRNADSPLTYLCSTGENKIFEEYKPNLQSEVFTYSNSPPDPHSCSSIEDQHSFSVEQILHQGSPKQVHPLSNNQISEDANQYSLSILNTQLRPNRPNQDLKNSRDSPLTYLCSTGENEISEECKPNLQSEVFTYSNSSPDPHSLSSIEDQHSFSVEQILHQGSPKQVQPLSNNQTSEDLNQYSIGTVNTQLRPNQLNQDLNNSKNASSPLKYSCLTGDNENLEEYKPNLQSEVSIYSNSSSDPYSCSSIEDQYSFSVEPIPHQMSPKQVQPLSNKTSEDVNQYSLSISNTQLRPNQSNHDLNNSKNANSPLTYLCSTGENEISGECKPNLQSEVFTYSNSSPDLDGCKQQYPQVNNSDSCDLDNLIYGDFEQFSDKPPTYSTTYTEILQNAEYYNFYVDYNLC